MNYHPSIKPPSSAATKPIATETVCRVRLEVRPGVSSWLSQSSSPSRFPPLIRSRNTAAELPSPHPVG
jgi:hypothetical protein